MKLYYYQDPFGNFGDDLNLWLWPRLLPGLVDDDESCLFIGIGTLLNEGVPKPPLKVVFGAGVGYGRVPVIDDRWKIYCLRGPLSAAALGLPADLAITDPAALVKTIPSRRGPARDAASFMPHHLTAFWARVQGFDIKASCDAAGVQYIDPCEGVEEVLHDIGRSKVLITEAMHGAIVADALRVPWIPVQLSGHILEFKWRDWCKSLGLEYAPTVWPFSTYAIRDPRLVDFIKGAKRDGRPTLSRDDVAQGAIDRLQERLAKLKTDRDAARSLAQDRGGLARAELPGDRPEAPPAMHRGVAPKSEARTERSWLHQILLAAEEISALIPPEDTFILVDQDEWGAGGLISGRRALPFLERDGQYWGPPPDDATAVRELERLRQAGASFIVFGWPAFWWLGCYTGLHRHLRARYRCALENDRLVVFALRSSR